MKKTGSVLIPLVLIIAAVIAWRLLVTPKTNANTLRVSGNIEVTDARLSFKIAGRLETCFVEEGDTIPKGGLLAQMENQDQKIGLRLAQAEAEYALVDEAEQRVNQAKQQLSYTKLFAPMGGIILTRSAEPGEYLNPSAPVVTLGNLDRPWLRAFINEKDLGRIRLKDKVTVTIDSFPDKNYTGILSFISSQAEFTPKSVQTFEERVKLMFRIKINLANPDGELKPGMPADALISLSEN